MKKVGWITALSLRAEPYYGAVTCKHVTGLKIFLSLSFFPICHSSMIAERPSCYPSPIPTDSGPNTRVRLDVPATCCFSDHQFTQNFSLPFSRGQCGGRKKDSGLEAAAPKPRLILMLRRVHAALVQTTEFDYRAQCTQGDTMAPGYCEWGSFQIHTSHFGYQLLEIMLVMVPLN